MADLIDLRRFGAHDLEALLLDEIEEWRVSLDWDFSASADLVRRFAESKALGGFALLDGADVAGYGYTVLEEQKGLIGDIFVRPEWRGRGQDARIFKALLDQLISTPRVNRIESQLMLMDADAASALQRDRFIKTFERVLMTLDESHSLPPAPQKARRRFYLEPWADYHLESAATVISLAYLHHVDAQINDQYRTLDGARRFLHNVVEFPGCGNFYRPASFIAFEISTGWVAGMVLSSFVADGVAHVTQLCVTPHAKGAGLGYELLRQAVTKLREAGAERITLTVTAANAEAINLYRRCGFREIRRFYAYVWESY